jgi:uncharacterized protein YoxC
LKSPLKKGFENDATVPKEIGLITDKVSTLQDDILYIKQTMYAAEKVRPAEIKTMCQSVETLKCEVSQCSKHITIVRQAWNL